MSLDTNLEVQRALHIPDKPFSKPEAAETGTAEEYQATLISEIQRLKKEMAGLRKRAAHYCQIFQQAPTGQVLLDASGITLEVNQAFCQMMDTDFSNILHKPFLKNIHHQERHLFRNYFNRFLKNDRPICFDIMMQTTGPDTHAQIAFKQISPSAEDMGWQGNILMSVTDISTRKQAEKQFRENNSRLNTILSDLPAMICGFNEQGVIFYTNNEFSKYYGRSGTPDRQENFFRILQKETGNSTKKMISLSPEHPVQLLDYEIPKGYAQTKWQRWVIRAIFTDSHDLKYYQAIGYDISEPKKAHHEETEKERLRSLMELSGAICHELRQPLQILLGLTDLIKLKVDPGTSLEKEMKQLQTQTVRINASLKHLEHITRYKTKSYAGDSKIIDLKNASDRRASKRHMTRQRFLVRSKNNGGFKGQMIDISKGGVSFWSDSQIDLSKYSNDMDFDIVDPSGNVMVCGLPCKVVRSNTIRHKEETGASDLTSFGMMFTDLDRGKSERLERFIHQWRVY